ncbi:MAG: VanZ family protein [Bacteroidetes bacterium]|nr:VanZ family protein [Bacteroidota bacterium]
MFWRHNGIAFFLTVLAGCLCLTPGKDLASAPFVSFDKFAHVVLFSLISLTWMVGLRKQSRFGYLRDHFFPLVITAGIFYGIALELIQGAVFADRFADWKDALANALGVVVGALIFLSVYGKIAFQNASRRSLPAQLLERFWP